MYIYIYMYIYIGYYTAARRYDFYLRVVKTIFYERAQRVSKILFLTREDKSHISSSHRVMFCLLYSPKQKNVKFHAQKQIVFITTMHVR